jgi:hypothetical protein
MARDDKLVAEKHQIKAGSQFTGETPDTDPDTESHIQVYSPDVKGGLFTLMRKQGEDPDDEKLKRRVRRISIQLADQSAWSLSITDGTTEYVIVSGTAETDVTVTDTIELAPSENLKLTTTGASLAMAATVYYEYYSVPR